LDFLLTDRPIFAPIALIFSALLFVAYFFDLWLMYFLPVLVLASYIFLAFRIFVWFRNFKKRLDDFKRGVGLRFWSRGFWSRVTEHRVENLKHQIEASKGPVKYLRLGHTLSWQFNKLKRKLDGDIGKDIRWDLTFECAYRLRQGLEAWWNSDRSQTKVVDWRDGINLCIIVGPHRIQAAMALMPDYPAFLALNDESIGKLLDQRFGLDTQSFHQISMSDGGTHFLRVTSDPSRHLPPGGRKSKTPALPNLSPLGDAK